MAAVGGSIKRGGDDDSHSVVGVGWGKRAVTTGVMAVVGGDFSWGRVVGGDGGENFGWGVGKNQ